MTISANDPETQPLLLETVVTEDGDNELKLPKTVYYKGHPVFLESKDITTSIKLRFQVLTCFLQLVLMGMLDQTVGTIMEYLLHDYQLERSQVSYLFISGFIGYISSSMLISKIQYHIGLRNLLLIGLCCEVFQPLMFAFKVPFGVLLCTAVILGFGQSCLEVCWNLFCGNLRYSNQVLGCMHGCYGLGCFISPILAIFMIERGVAWNHYYLLMVALGLVSMGLTATLFKNETNWKYQYFQSFHKDEEQGGSVSLKQVVTNKYVIFFSITLFTYVGSELTVGLWIFNYLLTIKHSPEKVASYITSSFWACMTAGRFVLGFVTGHYFEDHEIRATVLYTFIITVGCSTFWLFSNSLLIQVISIDIAGFFVGPLFATNMVMAIKVLPKNIANSAVPIICAFGVSGVSVIPYITGYLADHLGGGKGGGLKYFPDMTLVAFSSCFLLWFLFYITHKKKLDNCERLT